MYTTRVIRKVFPLQCTSVFFCFLFNLNTDLVRQPVDRTIKDYINSTGMKLQTLLPKVSSTTKVEKQRDVEQMSIFLKNNMTESYKLSLINLIDKWMDIAKQHNITWFIASGTLIGSYRHHDIIPWDTDVDVAVSRAARPALLPVLQALHEAKGVYITEKAKNYSRLMNGTVVNPNHNPKSPVRPPAVDIFWYEENSTHILIPKEKIFILKKTIFPLTERPLYDRMVYSPRDPLKAIKETYQLVFWEVGTGSCQTYPNAKLPCAALSSVYPMVRQRRSKAREAREAGREREADEAGEVCVEELVQDEKVLSTFTRPADGINQC